MSLAERRGAGVADDDEPVTIDRSKPTDRYRFVCPNGHIDYSKTNSHLWCRGCRRRIESGDETIDAEHYHILDKKRDVLIPWEQVILE